MGFLLVLSPAAPENFIPKPETQSTHITCRRSSEKLVEMSQNNVTCRYFHALCSFRGARTSRKTSRLKLNNCLQTLSSKQLLFLEVLTYIDAHVFPVAVVPLVYKALRKYN